MARTEDGGASPSVSVISARAKFVVNYDFRLPVNSYEVAGGAAAANLASAAAARRSRSSAASVAPRAIPILPSADTIFFAGPVLL